MTNAILRIVIVIIGVTLLNCSPGQEKKVEKARNDTDRYIKWEKQASLETLRQLRNEIDTRLERITEKHRQSSGSVAVELGAVKALLMAQRARTLKSLDNVKDSSDSNWDEIHQQAKDTIREVTFECEQMKARLDKALRNATR